MKRAAGLLANLVLTVSSLALLATFLAPALLGFSFNTILSESMTPTLTMGGVIGLQNVEPEEVRVGDIIGFKLEGMDTPVCHRVVEVVRTVEGVGFRTKGDASEDVDSWVVKPGNLLGKVIFHLPSLGYAAKFIKTPYGFALLVGVPGLVIVASEIKNLFSPDRTSDRRPSGLRRSDRTPAYLCLGAGLVVIACLWGMMAGNTRERTLGSFSSEGENSQQPGYVYRRSIRNNRSFPLVICQLSDDAQVTFSEDHFRLGPGEQKAIEMEGGSADAVITTGCFFPILPEKVLHGLSAWNVRFAPLVAAFVPVFPLMVAGFALLGGFSSSRPGPRDRAKAMRRLGY